MKIAVIYNKDLSAVINVFGMQNREQYNQKTVDRVAAALEKGGHNVRLIDGNMHVVDDLRSFMPRVISGDRPGMVFNMAYGIQGQSRYTHVPAFLEMLGVPYVGSSPAGHALALDKVMSKILFQHHGLPTPAFWVFNSPEEVTADVNFPAIVKPKMEAVSFGLKIVNSIAELKEAVEATVDEFKQQALVETFIPGREFAVGVLGNREAETLPILEIDLGGDPNGIQTAFDKQQKPKPKICPADVPEHTAAELRRLAVGAFHALGLYDFARVDFRMDADGNLYILEINSMASLGRTGSYVQAAAVAGYDFDKLVNRMIDVAVQRYFDDQPETSGETKTAGSGESEAGSGAKIAAAPVAKPAAEPLRVRVRGHIRHNLPVLLDNLEEMVEIDSNARNIDGVNRLGMMMANRLGQLGFNLQMFPQIEVGDIFHFANHTADTNDVLVVAHLDTSFGIQDYAPYREERTRIFGSGVAETKGSLAALLGALQALRFARSLKKIRAGILLISDASLGGKFGKKPIEEVGKHSRHIVGIRAADTDGHIIESCSGSTQYRIDITNRKRADAGKMPDVIGAACQKVIAWQKLTDDAQGIAVSATTVEARAMHGLVPDHASISLSVKFREKAQMDALDEQIRKIADKGIGAEMQMNLRKGAQRPAMVPGEGNKTFVEKVVATAGKLELRLTPAHCAEPTDVCFAPVGVPVVDGLGPVAGEFRTPTEFILRDSLVDRAALLAMVLRGCVDAERA